jgi:asparagine synthase (glutamine-hydrolysing)
VRHDTAPWSGLRRALEPPRRRAEREEAEWRPPAWLRRDLVARHFVRPERRTAHRTRPQSAAALSAADWESVTTMLDPRTSGVAHGFVLPYLDLRLIDFVYSVPPIPWLQKKWMLRRSFRGVLPEEVLARPKAPLRGYREALVAHWRASGGADRALPVPMDHWIDVKAWRHALRDAGDAEQVMAAWRVFEVARWLAQPAVR